MASDRMLTWVVAGMSFLLFGFVAAVQLATPVSATSVPDDPPRGMAVFRAFGGPGRNLGWRHLSMHQAASARVFERPLPARCRAVPSTTRKVEWRLHPPRPARRCRRVRL